MDCRTTRTTQRNRFLKLTLKKNQLKHVEETKKLNRSSDVIILDESFDRLKMDFPQNVYSSPKIYKSPIVINDSGDISIEEIPNVALEKEPSKAGNVSFNNSLDEDFSIMDTKKSRPSIGGWSPAQSIICASPRNNNIPSTPRDLANESLEQCSMKEIEKSHKKLLNDLYGEIWKSIPTLFKTKTVKQDNMNGVTKKLQFNDDYESDKENYDIKKTKELYLTASDTKLKKLEFTLTNTDKRSKKKLYTEKIPSTPDIPKQKPIKPKRNAATSVKKKKGMSVTELVETMNNDGDVLAKKMDNVTIKENKDAILAKKIDGNIDQLLKKNIEMPIKVTTPVETVKRLSFLGSLANNVPSWRCHVEAIQYKDSYKTLKEQLTRRLYVEFNKGVFGEQLDADMPIIWDTKLRSTAGTTTNRLLKNSKGDRIRTSSIKLSTKVLDAPQRLRDTLIHELCHAATWLIDGELRAGHGPLWKKWARRALQAYPELGEISRCHDLEIHFKYSYKCTRCGYSIHRHSKSIDITKKCCGYCKGTFEVIVNKKKKDGLIVSTPARKGGPNDFALYVKENYVSVKEGKTHAQVMKLLGKQFSAKKGKQPEEVPVDLTEDF